MSNQRENLSRVKNAIGEDVVRFAEDRGTFNKFHIEQLRSAIGSERAPGSPCRILRALRREGRLNYRVINRRASLYEFLPVGAA